MKIKIIKGVQFYFEEGDIIDTYTDEYCESLINGGVAISLEKEQEPEHEPKEMETIVGLEEKEAEEIIAPKPSTKSKKKK